MVTILVAEDERNLQLLIAARLRTQFQVLCASDGQEALDIIDSRHVDLLVADVMMPRMDGFELVQTLRRRGNLLPVLILTAKQTIHDKRVGFSSGTDDYLTKPVDHEELLWRIQALLRRARIATEQKITVGSAVLDSQRSSLTVPAGEIALPQKEFALLFKLLSYPGRIFTKAQLLDEVWGNSYSSGEDTVKTHISRLRSRLAGVGDFSLVTVKGLGYKAVASGVPG